MGAAGQWAALAAAAAIPAAAAAAAAFRAAAAAKMTAPMLVARQGVGAVNFYCHGRLIPTPRRKISHRRRAIVRVQAVVQHTSGFFFPLSISTESLQS